MALGAGHLAGQAFTELLKAQFYTSQWNVSLTPGHVASSFAVGDSEPQTSLRFRRENKGEEVRWGFAHLPFFLGGGEC